MENLPRARRVASFPLDLEFAAKIQTYLKRRQPNSLTAENRGILRVRRERFVDGGTGSRQIPLFFEFELDEQQP